MDFILTWGEYILMKLMKYFKKKVKEIAPFYIAEKNKVIFFGPIHKIAPFTSAMENYFWIFTFLIWEFFYKLSDAYYCQP